MTYYNDNDAFCAAWLAELMKDGAISQGVIDDRSIHDVQPADVAGHARVHAFSGIGGWDYALQLAGWPDDRPVWTASLPCQPFSVAGKREGERDARHLWPVFYDLVRECRPATIFGEQVPGAIRLGWLDRVFDDLEAIGYACGAVVLPACSVGAPHLRQRVFWVADLTRRKDHERERGCVDGETQEGASGDPAFGSGGGMGDGQRDRLETGRPEGIGGASGQRSKGPGYAETASGDERMGNTDHTEGARQRRNGGKVLRESDAGNNSETGHWSTGQYVVCADGKARLIESSIYPLAHGVPNRVGTLRGAGNSIVPSLAAQFVGAFLTRKE